MKKINGISFLVRRFKFILISNFLNTVQSKVIKIQLCSCVSYWCIQRCNILTSNFHNN